MTARERLIKAYTNLVKQGKITINSVPESIRADVDAAVQA